MSEPEHFDVLIVGAGLSGIGAACHIQERCPSKSFAILEARGATGGTWDLFRYPGIRSDSDMHTLGYRFRPWTEAQAFADGPSILRYVRETARERGIDRRIRLNHRVVAAEWSTSEGRWSVEVERPVSGERVRLTCDFLFACCGYYRYDHGHTPELPGVERFAGQIVHPQHWPGELDHAGKRVVVVGSGSTAVTLVPSLASDGARVTMLQRTPTYIVSVPTEDPIAKLLRRLLPPRAAFFLVRWKNVILQLLFYRASRRWPQRIRRLIRRDNERRLPAGFDVAQHFNPPYDPWDQRVCVAPDGDLFEAIRAGTASVVTDRIDTVTESGIRLESGTELGADLIITATGLDLVPFGGLELTVDGNRVELPETMAYKAMMLAGVPNFAFAAGYTNASWTLKADLTSEYVCRLLNHMESRGWRACVPVRDPTVGEAPFMDFTPGYVLRSIHLFPKQGTEPPWRVRQSYPHDLRTLRHGRLDEQMRFFGRREARASSGVGRDGSGPRESHARVAELR
jgi:cation diffusion facilitator CzcD-associated flavoprotein CzcO